MGNIGVIKVLIIDPESVNFDKICRLTLAIRKAHPTTIASDVIEVVKDGPHDFDVDGEEVDRLYWNRDGRSMTELYAIRTGLGKADASGIVCVESHIPGLVGLCRSLAENHGRVEGVNGGSLYKPGMIPAYAKSLTLLHDRASEIVGRLVKAVTRSLEDKHPIPAMIAVAGAEWDDLDSALASAERGVYEEALAAVRALHEGRYAHGSAFPLAKITGSPEIKGVSISTRNPDLMKHFWAALKTMDQVFKVATAVVSNPETKRIAVLCSLRYELDVRDVVRALRARFPKSSFDINLSRNSIVWDPRSGAAGPTPEAVQEAVSQHLALRKEEPKAQAPRFGGATLGGAIRQKAQQKHR